jgi:cell wall-associated NlpC family hydrolase
VAFDAGTIVAHLDLDDDAFARKLRADVAKIEEFEKRSHEIKLRPEVDQAGVSGARRAMEQADRRMTEDAHRRGGLLSLLMGGRGAAGGAGGQGGIFKRLMGAAGPSLNNLSPLGVKGSLIAAGVPLALGALPALAAPLLAGGVGLGGVGVAGLLGMQAAKPALGLAQAQSQAQARLAAASTPAQRQAAQQQLAQINQQAAQLSPALHSVFTDITGFQKWWQGFTKSLAPAIVGPVHLITSTIESLGPLIKQVFGGAMTLVAPFIRGLGDIARMVLPQLNQAFRAAAPLMRPLLDGLGRLVAGVLPGLVSLLRAARPAITVFSQILGTLGRDIGGMLKDFAPVLRSSAVIFKALMDVVSALFPTIGRLAAIFAKALAPVFVLFAGVIKSLLPFLVLLGKILAGFAAAVMGDLVGALGALATLLKDLSPSFTILAKVMGQVFRILENSGLFGVLANALEQTAGPLAKLVNSLVVGLAPILPMIISLLAQMLTILAGGLGAALGAVATALADIVNATPPGVLQAIALGLLAIAAGAKAMQIAKGLVQTYKEVRQALVLLTYNSKVVAAEQAAAWVKSTAIQVAQWVKQTAVQGAQLAKQWALNAANAVKTAAIWVAQTAVWVAQNAIRIAVATAAFIAENAATLGIIAGIALLVAAIIYLATHWRQVWGVIKRVAEDVWNFLTHGWGQYIILPLFAIRKAVEFVRDHWKQAWADMKRLGQLFWQWMWTDFGAKILNFMTRTLPNAFKTAVSYIGKAWDNIRNAVKTPVKFVIGTVLDGLIGAFDWITSHMGLGSPIKKVDVSGWQTGGRIPGYGGGDRHLSLLEGGEAVVSKETTAAHAADLSAWGVPGFQHGGRIGQHPIGASQARTGLDPSTFHGTTSPVFHKIGDIGKIMAAIATANSKALTNAVFDLFPHGVSTATADLARVLTRAPAMLLHDAVSWLISHGGGEGLGGRGPDIARYAMSFAGKIPYIWGGTSLSGCDCSGFTGAIYHHFGIHAPRTSEAQGQWVKRSSAVTGGLAFYNSPAGGPPPGHVAIVGFNGNVISQGGGLGPQIQGLRSMPLMFTGVPPGGAGFGPGNIGGLESIWTGAGGAGGQTAHIAAAIAMAESGGREVKQQGQPPGLTGWGLWQITPTSGIWNNGRFGNLLNDSNNARAAVYLWRQAGSSFSPWATYNSGAYQQFMDSGGWLSPGPNLVLNQTRRGEAVLTPGQSRAFIALSEAAEEFARGRGTAGGPMMRDVHLTLPEGTTVAAALREIGWHLRVTRQQGYSGVVG